MASENIPLLQKFKKDSLFETLVELSTEIVNEKINEENFNERKKEMIIKWFTDKLIKEHLKMMNY